MTKLTNERLFIDEALVVDLWDIGVESLLKTAFAKEIKRCELYLLWF